MVGFGDRVCMLCQQVIEQEELRKAKVLPIGASMGLVMHAACAQQWALDLETQGREKQAMERNKEAIRDALHEIRKGTEIMQKSSAVPFQVNKENNRWQQ